MKQPRPNIDDTRPFGAHVHMSGWKPLVVILLSAVVLLVSQILGYQLVGVLEGSNDPMSPTITPLKFLAVNLATIVTGVLAVLLLAWLARVPWRALISSPRGFDPQRLVHYLLRAAVLVAAGMGVVALVAPGSTGWIAFGVSGTTIAMLVVTLLTTPLQALGEELMFRSAILPAAASWVPAARPALVLGLVVSSLTFALLHGSTDPWLFGYFAFFSLCTGLMMIISRGIEAPVAFHVANNVLASIVNRLMADGGPLTIDRSSGTGDASVLILAAVNLAMLMVVWRHEQRIRATVQGSGGKRRTETPQMIPRGTGR